MNDRYVGDVGDFSKLALLRELDRVALAQGLDLETAVLWWATRNGEGADGDGRHMGFVDDPLFQRADSQLVAALRRAQQTRSLQALEAARVLRRARFHREALDAHEPMTPARRPALRAAWLAGAAEVARGAHVIFADPDNGLATARMRPTQKDAKKSAFVEELAQLVAPSQTLIVYHHATRTRVAVEAERLRHSLSSAFPSHGAVRVWRAPRFSPRYFALVPSRAHERVVEQLHAVLSQPKWNRILEGVE